MKESRSALKVRLEEKHIVMTSLIPGINLRRMSYSTYIATRDKIKERLQRKDGTIGLQRKAHVRDATLPNLRPMRTSVLNSTLPIFGRAQLASGGEKSRPGTGSAIWLRKLNNMHKGFRKFDDIKRFSIILLSQ